MIAYHQMGHNSASLISEPTLKQFSGLVLSPINEKKSDMIVTSEKFIKLHTIFDPQLYYPKEDKLGLKSWEYFPDQAHTSLQEDFRWYQRINRQLLKLFSELAIDAICSPTSVPKIYSKEFYSLSVDVTSDLMDIVGEEGAVYMTLLINLFTISRESEMMKICDIVTNSKISSVYLIFVSQINTANRYNDADQVTNAMKLIYVLKENKINVLVGFTCSESILWRFAGARSCATGKFHNLRRFSELRWLDVESKGSQHPYYFSQEYLSFFKIADLKKLLEQGLLSLHNEPFREEFLELVNSGRITKPVKLGWIQYLQWFGNFHIQFPSGTVDVERVIRSAAQNWADLHQQRVNLMESDNNGNWVNTWLQSIESFVAWRDSL